MSPKVLKMYVLKNRENCQEKYIGNRKIEFPYFNNLTCLAKILKLEHRVAIFSKTFYLLRQQK